MGLERLQAPAAHAPPPPAAGAAGTPAWCCMCRGWTHRERCRQPASRKSAVALAWVRRVHQKAVCTACREGLAGLPPAGQRCVCAGRPESRQLNISLGIYLGKGCWVMRTSAVGQGRTREACQHDVACLGVALLRAAARCAAAASNAGPEVGRILLSHAFAVFSSSSPQPCARTPPPPGAVALDSRCRLPHLDS
jgi:hypothetical protein